MKKLIYILTLILITTGCKDDDVRIFDKTADERTAEAIASLKNELTGAPQGWLLRYRPVEETGMYYVVLQFSNDNTVTIKTDLGASDGEYHEQTVSYRIDSSLGLELIFENYSFFSYLFELDQASFGAEYEFNYNGKTDDGELVFTSKTDPEGAGTQVIFEPATSSSINLLGREVGTNLDLFSTDLERFSSALKLTYLNKDLALYISLDVVQRIIYFNLATRKSNPNVRDNMNDVSTYYLEGDEIVLENPVQTNVSGTTERITRIRLGSVGETAINVCTDPFIVHTYSGTIESNDVMIETTMNDLAGATFAIPGAYYDAPLQNIRRNGLPLIDEITTDVAGALSFQLYYDIPLIDGTDLFGIGFAIRNNDGSVTFALKEFTPTINGNNIIFNFKPGFRLLESEETDANVDNINKYLDALTEGDKTYVFKYAPNVYEFHNPCTGWSFVMIKGN